MNNNNQNTNIFDKKTLEAIARDPLVRKQITCKNHLMFFHVYFPHYVKYPIAEFHKDIFRITENQSNKLACIVAFRGSGKSTLITFSYSLWSILGIQQKKFVVIICQTQAQAKQQMANKKYELEHNASLKRDLGPFKEENSGGEWGISSLVFQNTGARITIASVEQSIRGIRHRESRPDLIILDDVEDMNSVKTAESRNKIFDWFTREVVPLGDIGTRIIIVGNLLHKDSLVMRVCGKIERKELKGIFRQFPLLDKDGHCLWPGKFDTPGKIEELRQSVANELAWQHEYLLKPFSDIDRVVNPEKIRYYKKLPHENQEMKNNWNLLFACTAVDPAFTTNEYSNYSATVSALVYRNETTEENRIYILPWFTKAKLSEEGLIQRVKELINLIHSPVHEIFVEGGGAQILIAKNMQRAGLNAVSVPIKGMGKKERLYPAAGHIERGNVFFPELNSESNELIKDLTEFPTGSSDDLVDAFSLLVNQAMETVGKYKMPGITGFYKMKALEMNGEQKNNNHPGLPPMSELAKIAQNAPPYTPWFNF